MKWIYSWAKLLNSIYISLFSLLSNKCQSFGSLLEYKRSVYELEHSLNWPWILVFLLSLNRCFFFYCSVEFKLISSKTIYQWLFNFKQQLCLYQTYNTKHLICSHKWIWNKWLPITFCNFFLCSVELKFYKANFHTKYHLHYTRFQWLSSWISSAYQGNCLYTFFDISLQFFFCQKRNHAVKIENWFEFSIHNWHVFSFDIAIHIAWFQLLEAIVCMYD